ncbi:MAG: hypothetical protein WBD22_15390 [Pyrinomonadaceae bacterium]
MSDEQLIDPTSSEEANAETAETTVENGGAAAATAVEPQPVETEEEPVNADDVSYHAVEKEGTVTAIWEMQGQKHLRTIDPRSAEGKQILALFETAA